MSDFEAWFIAQHGPRERGMSHTDERLQDLIDAGKTAERVLDRRRMWDEKFQAALYAWQARAAK